MPSFYRWFLRTMGRNAGPFAKERQDLCIDSILRAYQEGLVEPDPRYLLIASDTREYEPMLAFYDLDEPKRDDALVLIQQDYEGYRTRSYETFREMFAHANLNAFRIREFPCFCDGKLKKRDGDVPAALDGITEELGFFSSVPSGPFSKVLERADAAMTCTTEPNEDSRGMMFFELGGKDEGTLRGLLEKMSTGGGLDIQVRGWGGTKASQPR